MAFINFQPKDYFNTVLYNGTGSSQSITGVGFQPDWLWQKSRSNSQDGRIFDAVRGGSKVIYPSLTNAESTDAQLITSFDSDGFTMGSAGGNVNDSGTTNVAWNWRASGTSGSSNTDGSITSTVSANTTAGFSVVKWTGSGANATIGHGLGAVPKMIIIKSLANTTFWMVYHSAIGNDSEIYLNKGDYVASASSTAWQDTDPTSSVFYVGGGGGDGVNVSGDYIAYCFAEKKGFSKFSKYNGVGATTGQFVYTGFKPAFVMTKIATTGGSDTGGWVIMDNKSYPNNLSNSPVLFANGAYAQSDSYNGEMFSNGFRFNANSVTVNGSGNSYIYMAFAEEPLVSSNGVAATAR
jgi:hypothetical protein